MVLDKFQTHFEWKTCMGSLNFTSFLQLLLMDDGAGEGIGMRKCGWDGCGPAKPVGILTDMGS